MNQFIGFCILLGGLFGIATVLLWRLPWSKREPWRSILEGFIVVVDLVVALFLCRYFSQHSFELITTTLACSHFSFVVFWCVTSRGPSVLRLVLFLIVVATMFGLFLAPREYFIHKNAMENDWGAYQALTYQALTQRLIITCVATWMAGICCRIRGWRLESPLNKSLDDQADWVPALQTVPLIIGLVIAVPCVVWLHAFVSNSWTYVFDRDFSILELGCIYGLLMLAGLAITACRFKWQWVGAGIAIALTVWLLWELKDVQPDSFHQSQQFRVPSRYGVQFRYWLVLMQYRYWLVLGTLWWWLVWKHLQGVGFTLRRTDESILTRPKLKHVMIAMVFMAVLFTSVKSRYFDRYEDLIRQQVSHAEPGSGPIESLTFASYLPERVTRNLGRLKKLRRLGFYGCTIDADLMEKVTQLKNLESISFMECVMNAPGLKGIESLEDLKHVEFINNTSTTPADDLRRLSQLQNLEYLALSDLSKAGKLSLPRLKHLDLSFCTKLQPKQLYGMNLINVQTIKFSRAGMNPGGPAEVAFPGVPSSRLFPQLVELNIALSSLNSSDIDSIKGFSHLKRLEIIGCTDGLHHLHDLEIEHLSLRNGAVTGETLDILVGLSNVKSLELIAVVKPELLREHIDKIVELSRQYKLIDLKLFGTQNSMIGSRMFAFTVGSPMPFDLDPQPEHEDMRYIIDGLAKVVVKSGRFFALENVTIEFDDFLHLMSISRLNLGNVTIVHDGRKMNKQLGIMFGQGPSWHELTGDELSRILASDKDKEGLNLADPKLTLDDYSKLDSSKLKHVSVKWTKPPTNWEQIAEKLLSLNLRVRIQLDNDQQYLDAVKRLSQQGGERIEFTNYWPRGVPAGLNGR